MHPPSKYLYLSFRVSGVIFAADYYELMDLCDGGLQFFPMCFKVIITQRLEVQWINVNFLPDGHSMHGPVRHREVPGT